MSTTVERKRSPPGDNACVEEAWELKEHIRREFGVLKQQRRFFVSAYRQSSVLLLINQYNDELVGFAATRNGGYLLFLAVSPDYQGQGFGRELVYQAVDEHGSLTCHARMTNDDALGFYRALGFEIVRSIPGYYEDGGDAYFLKLGEDASMRAKISRLLGR